MEHIVQFGINLDDASIAEAIKRDAYNDVVKKLTEEARRALPKEDCWRGGKVDWRGIVGREVEKQVSVIVASRSDEIVDMAVKRVFKSLTGRKSFRDACKKMDIVFDGFGGDDDGQA